jgi:hypothetical protein
LFLAETSATPEEAEQFKDDVHAITRDTPEATLASSRIRKALGKIAPPVAKQIGTIRTAVASGAVKRMLFGH